MTDKHSPHMVDWAITERCNLKCKHCRGMAKGGLSTERARELISEIASLKPGWVVVEGGEPLLRPDLFELLGLMRQKGLEVHLITNGMLLTPQIIADLKRLGVRVMISIDGGTAETYEAIRTGASFDRVVQAAKNCARAGILEAINTTIVKGNQKEVPAIFKLAASIGVKKVTFIGLKPCHGYLDELLTPGEYRQAIPLVCQSARETGIEFFFDEPFFWAAVKKWKLSVKAPAAGAGILVPETSECIFGEYLFIDTDGRVKPCSFSPLSLGNLNDKRLDRIWGEVLDSPFLRRVRDPASRTGNCRDCEYLAECMGCRSRTFVLTGDWFASDPACPLIRKTASKKVEQD